MDANQIINAFIRGYKSRARREMTDREIATRHPEMTPDERQAYANGQIDRLAGDTTRAKLLGTV